MILHILGGGDGQLNAIRRCRELGIKTFVTDADPEASGCVLADFSARASTFNADETADAAEKFMRDFSVTIGGLLVTGTDQPVLIAAETASRLGIPYFLDIRQAGWVTDKRMMKQQLKSEGIPVLPFSFIRKGFSAAEIKGIKYPVVVKPLDSQGQRGVYRLESAPQVRERFGEVISYSRKNEILVEEYYDSDEITVSGWVEGGSLRILSVTDRRTIDNLPGIGVCVSHQYPSKYEKKLPEIESLTAGIVRAFKIKTGPVYFQYLIGDRGIIVNETACRLGGAYEDQFIPFITGVDILDVMIRMSCGMNYNRELRRVPAEPIPDRVVSLQMFFCGKGRIAALSGMEDVRMLPGVRGGRFLLSAGTEVENRLNSTQRAGYFIVCCGSKEEADRIVRKAYSLLKIEEEGGFNMIRVYDKMLFGGQF